jgi:hypothetical protein
LGDDPFFPFVVDPFMTVVFDPFLMLAGVVGRLVDPVREPPFDLEKINLCEIEFFCSHQFDHLVFLVSILFLEINLVFGFTTSKKNYGLIKKGMRKVSLFTSCKRTDRLAAEGHCPLQPDGPLIIQIRPQGGHRSVVRS